MEFSAERDVPRLKELAQKEIYLGTSSWKYPGWIGQVYKGDYSGPRSPVNKKRFETECLAEYAEIFPTVCLDEGYWKFPDPKRLSAYSEQVPDEFKFSIKVTKDITERRNRQGSMNPSYLDPRLYTEHFFEPTKSAF